MYTVHEDVVVVEVCTIVYRPTGSCPIAFDFTVDFFTADNSASKYYIHQFVTYVMRPRFSLQILAVIMLTLTHCTCLWHVKSKGVLMLESLTTT